MDIKQLYEQYTKDLSNYKKIEAYLKGQTDATLTYQQTDRSNLKVNCNYLKKFVKEEASYSVGNNITYQSKAENEEIINELDLIMENYKENHDIETFANQVGYGIAYEIHYIDKWEQLQVRSVKPTQGKHIEDEEGNLISFIYVYTKTEYENGKEKIVTYIDNYTDTEIEVYRMNEDKFNLVETIPHYFGEIPVGVAKLTEDTWEDTIYNDIKGLQDALETNLSDITNEISDFRNAYLVLTGISLEEEDAKNMKANGIIEMPLAEGKAEWLIKNINDTFIQNTLATLQEKIYELTSHINHNDSESTSNASGVALKSRLIALMQRCKINEGAYRELLKTRIRIILTFLKIKKNKTYDWKDIKIVFTPNIPNDDIAVADLMQKLDGKLSASTGLQMLSFVENGQAEYDKAQTEITESAGDLPFSEAPSFNTNNEIEEEA